MAVTQEQINAWKQEHKFVFKIVVDGIEYFYRTLNRDDYLSISAKQAENVEKVFDHELETVKACLLNNIPEDELKAKAGVVTLLSEKILSRSGFQQVTEEVL